MRTVRYDCANHARQNTNITGVNVGQPTVLWYRLVVQRAAKLQRLALEVDAIEGHALSRLINRSTLQKCKVFVPECKKLFEKFLKILSERNREKIQNGVTSDK